MKKIGILSFLLLAFSFLFLSLVEKVQAANTATCVTSGNGTVQRYVIGIAFGKNDTYQTNKCKNNTPSGYSYSNKSLTGKKYWGSVDVSTSYVLCCFYDKNELTDVTTPAPPVASGPIIETDPCSVLLPTESQFRSCCTSKNGFTTSASNCGSGYNQIDKYGESLLCCSRDSLGGNNPPTKDITWTRIYVDQNYFPSGVTDDCNSRLSRCNNYCSGVTRPQAQVNCNAYCTSKFSLCLNPDAKVDFPDAQGEDGGSGSPSGSSGGSGSNYGAVGGGGGAASWDGTCHLVNPSKADAGLTADKFCGRLAFGCKPVCPEGYAGTGSWFGSRGSGSATYGSCPYGYEDEEPLQFVCSRSGSASCGNAGSCRKCKPAPGTCTNETTKPEGKDWKKVDNEEGMTVEELKSKCTEAGSLKTDSQTVNGDKVCWYKCIEEPKVGAECEIDGVTGTYILADGVASESASVATSSGALVSGLVTAYDAKCGQNPTDNNGPRTWIRPRVAGENITRDVYNRLIMGKWLEVVPESPAYACAVCPCSDMTNPVVIDAQVASGGAMITNTLDEFGKVCTDWSRGDSPARDVYNKLIEEKYIRQIAQFENLYCAACDNTPKPDPEPGIDCPPEGCPKCPDGQYDGELFYLDSDTAAGVMERYKLKFKGKDI